MHEIYELKDMLCEELEKYGSKGDLNTGELEIVDKLAHAVKNLGKIIEMADEEEYSGEMMGGGSYQRGGQGGNRGGGGSYRGGSYRGSYARGDGRSRGGGNNPTGRNQYSRERGYSRAADDMVEQLRDMMEEAPDQQTRKEIQRLITKMEQMM